MAGGDRPPRDTRARQACGKSHDSDHHDHKTGALADPNGHCQRGRKARQLYPDLLAAWPVVARVKGLSGRRAA